VFWVIAGFGAATGALGVASTGARAKASAERVRFLLDPPLAPPSPARAVNLLSSP
jgi:hypothetical protein